MGQEFWWGVIALAVGTPLLFGSVIVFRRGKTLPSLFQLLGASGLPLIGFFFILYALHFIPGWLLIGKGNLGEAVLSVGALLTIACFPAGFMFCALSNPSTSLSKK